MTAQVPVDDPVSLPGAGSRRPRVGSRFGRLAAFALVAVLVTAGLRAFVVDTYYVADPSFATGVDVGDRVLLLRLATPEAGDLVAVRLPMDAAHPGRGPHRAEGLTGRLVGSVSDALGVDLGEQSALVRVDGGDSLRDARDSAIGVAVLRYWPLSRFGTPPTGPTEGGRS